ncbi:MAG: hypothetical protein ACREO3_12390, partial [Arenimonas sp.]
MRSIDWANVIATAACLALLGGGALYFSTYRPKPMTAQEAAASRVRNLANCGAGMFDVVPHDAACPRFDAIALDSSGCWPDCDSYLMTLHADGRAVLDVTGPESERGHYTARVS